MIVVVPLLFSIAAMGNQCMVIEQTDFLFENERVYVGLINKKYVFKKRYDRRILLKGSTIEHLIPEIIPKQTNFKELAKTDHYYLTTLEHPNIVKGFDCAYEERLSYTYFMEYCENGSIVDYLNQIISDQSPTQEYINAILKGMTRDILTALVYLHGKGVYHLDLKPENILAKFEENRILYKLTDFEFATESKRIEVLYGTHQYHPPENIPFYEKVHSLVDKMNAFDRGSRNNLVEYRKMAEQASSLDHKQIDSEKFDIYSFGKTVFVLAMWTNVDNPMTELEKKMFDKAYTGICFNRISEIPAQASYFAQILFRTMRCSPILRTGAESIFNTMSRIK